MDNIMEHMFCEFENTSTKFNNRDIYACKFCGTKLLLDDPTQAKMMCFAKKHMIYEMVSGKPDDSIDGLNETNFMQYAMDKILKDTNSTPVDKDPTKQVPIEEILEATEKQSVLCSEEQIQSRLSICNKCEYYQDDSCLLCGCTVVREANYKNKLALKNQSCPINKWQQIND